MNNRHFACAIGIAAATCSTVVAHPGHDISGDAFAIGWVHPWLGLDHLLAMVAVGLLSVQMSGRAILILPASFLGTMVLGGAIGMSGAQFPLVEFGIALSVFALGAALAVGRKYPATAVAMAIATCGILHGYAHGTEMPNVHSSGMYAVGFVAATAVLHAIGTVGGLAMLRRERWVPLLRISGAAISMAGILLLLEVL